MPANIAFLWENGDEIPPHRVEEALVAWQGARKRASAMDVGAGEELCVLTHALAVAAEAQHHLARARALIEAALECLPLPRQRTVLLGLMARMAVRAGDVGAGAAWLSCFEPSQDLESDSEYRVTTAFIATAWGDYRAVLKAIGPDLDAVAIQDSIDATAIILRVNALERTGHAEEASRQLQAFIDQGPAQRNVAIRILKLNERMRLCQGTMPAVEAAHERRARTSTGSGQIALGALLIGVSLLPFVIAVVTAIDSFRSSGSFSVQFLVFSIIFGPPFGGWGMRTLRNGNRERRAFVNGVRVAARVLDSSPTGTYVNGVPEMRIDLQVDLTPPVRSALRMLVHPGQQAILLPGTLLFVRVDPQIPELAVLDQ